MYCVLFILFIISYYAFNDFLIGKREEKEGEENEKGKQEKSRKELPKGHAEYNKACIAAVRGRKEECMKYLKQCEEMEAYKDNHLWKTWKKDPDLESVRNESWFIDMVARIEGQLAFTFESEEEEEGDG